MYKKGDSLCVTQSGKPYAAKVTSVSGDLKQIRVHFVGFNARHDETIDLDGGRIVVDEEDFVNSRSVLELEKSFDDAVESLSYGGCDGGAVVTSGAQLKRKRTEVGSDGSSPDQRLSKRPSVQLERSSGHPNTEDVCLFNFDTADRAEEQRNGEGRNSSPVSDERPSLQPRSQSSPVSPMGVDGVGLSNQGQSLPAPKCALCCGLVEGRRICCGSCDRIFHADRRCVGVDDAAIDVLLGGDAVALRYVCCACRVGGEKGGGAGGVAGEQLMSIISSLAADVRRVTEVVADLQRQSSGRTGGGGVPVGASAGGATGTLVQGNASVMSEVRELYEREKRKSSVVLRGVNSDTVAGASDLFRDLCQYLQVGVINLEEVVGIAPGVFRGKIACSESRYSLLAHAKDLRRSELYSRVYIQKDLTFRQRGEVIAKRAAAFNRRQVSGDVAGGSGSAPGNGEPPSAPLSGANVVVVPPGGHDYRMGDGARGRGVSPGGRGLGSGVRGRGLGLGGGGRGSGSVGRGGGSGRGRGAGAVRGGGGAFPPLYSTRQHRRLNY